MKETSFAWDGGSCWRQLDLVSGGWWCLGHVVGTWDLKPLSLAQY